MNNEIKKRIFNILGPINFPETVLAEFVRRQKLAGEPYEVFMRRLPKKDFQEELLFCSRRSYWKTSLGYFEKLKFLLIGHYLETTDNPLFQDYLKVIAGSQICLTDAVRKIIRQKEKKIYAFLMNEVTLPQLEENAGFRRTVREMLLTFLLFGENVPDFQQEEDMNFFLDMAENDAMPVKY